MTDIEIAQAHEMKPITEIAAAAGIDEQHLELYGKYKAKLDLTEIRKLPRKAKLILATAMIIKGIRKQRMAESQGSMNMVTTTPPSIRIGARTPMRWIMFRVRCRL